VDLRERGCGGCGCRAAAARAAAAWAAAARAVQGSGHTGVPANRGSGVRTRRQPAGSERDREGCGRTRGKGTLGETCRATVSEPAREACGVDEQPLAGAVRAGVRGHRWGRVRHPRRHPPPRPAPRPVQGWLRLRDRHRHPQRPLHRDENQLRPRSRNLVSDTDRSCCRACRRLENRCQQVDGSAAAPLCERPVGAACGGPAGERGQGDDDASEWLPDNRRLRLRRYPDLHTEYGLSVTPAEHVRWWRSSRSAVLGRLGRSRDHGWCGPRQLLKIRVPVLRPAVAKATSPP
jgi:hypothetical protein